MQSEYKEKQEFSVHFANLVSEEYFSIIERKVH